MGITDIPLLAHPLPLWPPLQELVQQFYAGMEQVMAAPVSRSQAMQDMLRPDRQVASRTARGRPAADSLVEKDQRSRLVRPGNSRLRGVTLHRCGVRSVSHSTGGHRQGAQDPWPKWAGCPGTNIERGSLPAKGHRCAAGGSCNLRCVGDEHQVFNADPLWLQLPCPPSDPASRCLPLDAGISVLQCTLVPTF